VGGAGDGSAGHLEAGAHRSPAQRREQERRLSVPTPFNAGAAVHADYI
jgi:hypothetical protein